MALGNGARLCRPRPAAAPGKLPTPSNFPRAAAGLRHSRAPFQWRGQRDPGAMLLPHVASSPLPNGSWRQNARKLSPRNAILENVAVKVGHSTFISSHERATGRVVLDDELIRNKQA